MPLPTCSVRALPEHHQLLRRIGRALVTCPELAESLDALIGGVPQDVTRLVTQDMTRPNTAVDQRFEDIERRLERLEAEAVLHSETQALLPQPDTRDTLPQHTAPAVTRQPRHTSPERGAGGGKKRLTDEQDRLVAEMLKAGRSYPEIGAAIGRKPWSIRKIKDRLAEQGLLDENLRAEPASHVDDNPEPPAGADRPEDTPR